VRGDAYRERRPNSYTRSTMVSSSKIYQEFCEPTKYFADFTYIEDFDFPYMSFRIDLDAPIKAPIYTGGSEVSAWVSVERRTCVPARPDVRQHAAVRSVDATCSCGLRRKKPIGGATGSEDTGPCPDNSRSI